MYLFTFSSALTRSRHLHTSVKVFVMTTEVQCSFPQYEWDDNEMFLFRASLAYAMRSHLADQKFE